MDIKRAGTQPSAKGPADWFIGTVRIDPLFAVARRTDFSGASLPRSDRQLMFDALLQRVRAIPGVRAAASAGGDPKMEGWASAIQKPNTTRATFSASGQAHDAGFHASHSLSAFAHTTS